MARLIVVSNRTPQPGKPSAGGLATALEVVLKERNGLWFGWSGEFAETPGPVRMTDVNGVRVAGIDLSRADHAAYYAGFSNSVLWPSFHLRPDLAELKPRYYEGYHRVNEQFADALVPLIEPEDIIWVHDYHLIPLGDALRRRGLRNRIGYFLHIPFPSPDALATIPSHRDLVNTFAAYDLVGFQANRDVAALHEFASEEGFVRLRASSGAVEPLDGLNVRAFPIGSDPEAFSDMAVSDPARKTADKVCRSLDGRTLILGVDRLDYTKGLPQRIAAYERLLDAFKQHRRKVAFLQIAPPSREMIAQYQEISDTLDSACGRVLGRFAEPDWQPLNYVKRAYNQPTLAALYRLARVCLVTPLRDGMNLVAHEFIGSQDPENPGVLVLSIFAGAAEIFPQALLVNPYDADETARALDVALRMPLQERQERWNALIATAKAHDVAQWAEDFLLALQDTPARAAV